METEKIFNYLGEFKKIPTYQLERRVDPFILPYLESALKNKFNNAEFRFVCPEFPLKRLTQKIIIEKQHKLSEYADYLLWSPQLNTIYFIEFKTEVKSIDQKQFQNYFENCRLGWKQLLEYYLDKAIGNKKYWKKFVNALIYIENNNPNLLGLNDKSHLEKYLEIRIGVHNHLKKIKESIVFEAEPLLKFLYLAPENAKSKLDSYLKNKIEYADYYEGLITLKDFARFTPEPLKTFLKSI